MEQNEQTVNTCAGCLCVGHPLYQVTDDKLKQYYMDVLNEVQLPNVLETCPNLCWKCISMLKKVVSFREQVKDSFRILQTYKTQNSDKWPTHLLTEVTRPYPLQIHKLLAVDIPPDCSPDDDDDDDDEHIKKETQGEVQHIYVKEEYTGGLDHDSLSIRDNSDAESEANLNEIETELESLIKGVRKRKKIGTSTVKSKRAKKIAKRVQEVKKNLIKRSNNIRNRSRTIEVNPIHINDEIYTNEESVTAEYKTEIHSSVDYVDNVEKNQNVTRLVKIHKSLESLMQRSQKKKMIGQSKVKKRDKKGIGDRESNKQDIVKSASDKIITIELSYEEVLLERERESTSKGYLNSPYKCESCVLSFKDERSYNRHVTSKHCKDIGEYKCSICNTYLANVKSLTSHYKRHLRRYECSICHKKTLDMKVMEQHFYSSHETTLKQYTCNVCGKINNAIDAHRNHLDSHKSRVACPNCDKTFSHRAGLMNHRLTVHEAQNKFPCAVCDKVFRWKTSLKRHQEKHDTSNAPCVPAALCSECNVTFASVSSYQRHLKNSLRHVTHDQLRFTCDHCGRRFADKTKLRDHIEDKHLHRTFQCHICLKTSKNRVNLDQHVRNVHRGRPNNKVCNHCGKRFPTKVQLESHIRTHTGERPFICEYCPSAFSQQSNLHKHIRQVHLNIKSKRYPLSKKDPTGTRIDVPTLTQPTLLPLHYAHSEY